MKRINKYFDQVYCLYLDKRYDRHEYISQYVDHYAYIAGDGTHEDLKYNRIDTEDLPPIFKQSTQYPTWREKPHAFNAWMCHNAILNDALDNGYNRILLLEDDVEFAEDLDEALDNFENSYPWDMFYFGCFHDKSYSGPTKGVRQVFGAGGFHGVALTRKVIELLCLMPPIGPYDWICGKYLHNSHRCFASHPMVINQMDGYSYVERQELSKPSRFETLAKCDIGSHSTYLVLKEIEEKKGLSIKDKKVLHIGAHDGLEKDIYNHLGASSTIWVECNPFVVESLRERIKDDERHTAYEACLWSETGVQKNYFFYRDKRDGAGGLFKDKKMKDYVLDCPMTGEKTELTTITLDDLAYKENFKCNDIGFLNIDVQGSELEVLKGAESLFTENLEFIYCEVSWDEIYENGPLLEDIDKFLDSKGYDRVGIRKDWAVHGDAIYVRRH